MINLDEDVFHAEEEIGQDSENNFHLNNSPSQPLQSNKTTNLAVSSEEDPSSFKKSKAKAQSEFLVLKNSKPNYYQNHWEKVGSGSENDATPISEISGDDENGEDAGCSCLEQAQNNENKPGVAAEYESQLLDRMSDSEQS